GAGRTGGRGGGTRRRERGAEPPPPSPPPRGVPRRARQDKWRSQSRGIDAAGNRGPDRDRQWTQHQGNRLPPWHEFQDGGLPPLPAHGQARFSRHGEPGAACRSLRICWGLIIVRFITSGCCVLDYMCPIWRSVRISSLWTTRRLSASCFVTLFSAADSRHSKRPMVPKRFRWRAIPPTRSACWFPTW